MGDVGTRWGDRIDRRPTHYVGPNSRVRTGHPVCGAMHDDSGNFRGTPDPAATTCKRCIASLRADGLLPREVPRG